MTTILTDADGNRYEATPDTTFASGYLIAKPVQPEEEKTPYSISVAECSTQRRDKYIETLQLTPTQATALADAVKALVEYVQTPYDSPKTKIVDGMNL